MECKFKNINIEMTKSIFFKAVVFICLLFIFSKWDTIEKYLQQFLNK
jgi:hypothetical protein